MHARTGLLGFFLATVLIAIAYGSAFIPGGTPGWAPWLMAVGTAMAMVSAMLFGASRADRALGPLAWVFGAAFVVIAGGFCLALALTPPAGGEPIWFGLPRRAAILIYGIGLLPVFLLPVAYAMTFDRVTLSDADLASFRARLGEIRQRGATPPAGVASDGRDGGIGTSGSGGSVR
ncbi:MAG: hypothetical protein H0X64_10335 [Gemmatimonadaceae bacterium]|nr:hypothetical protein [Gemmatimonadaceae bacterium]